MRFQHSSGGACLGEALAVERTEVLVLKRFADLDHAVRAEVEDRNGIAVLQANTKLILSRTCALVLFSCTVASSMSKMDLPKSTAAKGASEAHEPHATLLHCYLSSAFCCMDMP